MDGVVNVYKPMGPTSHDIVDRMRRLFGQKRVGHAGTLDPMATGVLVVCLGKATRIVEYLTDSVKEYHATMVLGVRTDSQDATGVVISESDASQITPEAFSSILARFRGSIEQVPPMISALKHEGKPLYKHAREGRTIERPARQVTVHSIHTTGFRPGDRAEVDLVVVCSSGTYIRTLCADIGEALGCGGMMSRLERTRVGGFDVSKSATLDDLATSPESHVVAVADALGEMSAVELDKEAEWRVVHGLSAAAECATAPGSTVRLVATGELIGIGVVGEDGASVRPRKIFADAGDQAGQ